MLMIDCSGTVLAHYLIRQEFVGKEFKNSPLLQEMLSKSEGLITATALDGFSRIFGYVHLPGTQTLIAVGLDEKEVLVLADRAMWMASLVFLLRRTRASTLFTQASGMS